MSNENLMICYKISMCMKLKCYGIRLKPYAMLQKTPKLTHMERIGIIIKVLLVVCKNNEVVDSK